MLRFLAPLLLLAPAACSSGPSEEERTLGLFHAVAYAFEKYNAEYALQNGAGVERVAVEMRRLVDENFDRVVEGLASPDPQRQADAAFALGFSKNPGAQAVLSGAAGAGVPEVRGNALAALGMLGRRDAPMEVYARALRDPAEPVRTGALFGLRNLLGEASEVGSNGLLDLVHEKLSDPEMRVRNEALILLRRLKRKESLPFLLGRPVRDLDPLVRSNAALTVAALGREAAPATPHLIEMLRDEHSKVVESAMVALNHIHEKDFDRSYGTWRDWYEDEQRHFYTCAEHRELILAAPGDCPTCRKRLERLPRDPGRKADLGAVVYGCPDHPEVQTTAPARCGKPGCGKELAPRKPEAVPHSCPEHPEVVTTGPAKCGKAGCGKDLVPKK
jgi:hypothetical protein